MAMTDQPTKRSMATTITGLLAAGAGIVAILNFVTTSRWQMSELEQRTDRYGGQELRDFAAPGGPAECGRACVSDNACQAYSFNTRANQCWLKSNVPLRRDNDDFVSAVKVAKPWWKIW
jgi:hypothetical protein